MGIFHPYIPHADVRLIGVEAAGEGIATGHHAASLLAGRPGVLHGNRTYLLQDADGQIIETHSVSAGLDYPGVGPEHAWLKDTKRAEYVAITDDEALAAFHECCRIEGIIPALESAHALAYAAQARCDDGQGQDPARQSFRPRRQGHEHRGRAIGTQVLLPAGVRSRGAHEETRLNRIDATFAKLRSAGRTGLIPYVTVGDPSLKLTLPIMHALVAAGADVIELGVPFSDPMADGPVIQRASERALAQHVGLKDVLATVPSFRRTDSVTPVVLMGYANPIEAMGVTAFADRAREAGVDGVLVVDYPPEEAVEFAALLDARAIAPIFLLSPTTPEARIAAVARIARGYVYYVSLKGVTGAGHLDTAEVARKLAEIRRHVALPVGVGFGIRDAASAQAIAAHADAVVIGSRIIQEIEGGPAGHRRGARRRVACRHPQRARCEPGKGRSVPRHRRRGTGAGACGQVKTAPRRPR